MSYGSKEIGPNRFRESIGRFYEDFEVGHIFEHRPGRTITETDNIWFTNLTMNTHPIHFDVAYAKKSEFKKPLVNSALTLSMVAGMSVSDTSQKAIANLGWNNIKLVAPVFVGDTLYAETEILEKHATSKGDRGIVYVETRGYNQRGQKILTMRRRFLCPKLGS